MKLHKSNKDIKQVDPSSPVLPGVTNNNLFIGSTTDLQRMLQDEKVIDGDTETG